jgi:hypothetical protein
MNRKWIKLGIAAIGVVGLAAGSACAAMANLTEKWDSGASGWTAEGLGSVVYSGGHMELRFGRQSTLPSPQKGSMVGTDLASGGRFAGDYVGLGITAVSFDVKVSGPVGAVVFYFYSASGAREWGCVLDLPAGAADWTSVTVPLAYSENWFSWDGLGTADDFKADLASVASVGVRGYRNGSEAQVCSVDNVKLIGPWTNFTADGLPEAWLLEYLGLSGEGHAGEDPDHDGFSNLGEFLAGTGPNDGSSYLMVQIERDGEGKALLKWNHSEGRSFRVLRTRSLGEPFEPYRSGIASTGPKNTLAVDDETDGPYFYKVAIEQ